MAGAIGVDVTYTMRRRGSRSSSKRKRKRSSYACVMLPLPSPRRSSVTEGMTTTDSFSRFRRIASHTVGMLRWRRSKRW